MMNIVIVGAGEIGRYIASILSKEQHNIILIDKDPAKLRAASTTMDVGTRLGFGSDWQLLDDLLELSPDYLLALTNDDETNLVTCDIAKHLGYPHTICRIRDNSYLNRTRLDFARIFDVDYFIGPELLVANEILKYMISPGSVSVESFAHGAVQMRTVVVPEKWRKSTLPLKELNLPDRMMVALIKRVEEDRETIIFPHGSDSILPGDQVTLIGETDVIVNVHRYFGIEQDRIETVVIIGGSLTALNLARVLVQNNINVRLIEKDYERCVYLSTQLPDVTIVNHDGTDLEFLKAEKIDQADILVACTRHDEINLMSALMGKEAGCKEAIVILANASYISIASKLGISHVIAPRAIATNHILSQILSGTVTSLVSLYDNQAEIMEVIVSMDSKLVGVPLSELGPLLPNDFLICMIQNRGRTMVANGNRIISPGDSVILMTSPKHVSELEKLF